MAEMLRYNAGKAPLSLIPTTFTAAIVQEAVNEQASIPTKLIWEVGQVLDFGAKKYSAHNWRTGGSWSSVLNSGLRHMMRLIEGHDIDAESGLSETGHLGCNLAFLIEFQKQNLGTDDRFKVQNDTLFKDQKVTRLTEVLSGLLSWQDGGDISCLQKAAYSLACFAEAKPPSEQLKLDLILDKPRSTK